MNKTKKIKIIATIILSLVAIITIGLIVLSTKTTYHGIDFCRPSQIIVYYNSETNNVVFEQGDEYYNKIYNSIVDAYKQPILSAFLSNKLFKDVKIVKNDATAIKFDGIFISFVYDLPQAVKYKNKMYIDGGETYWYQTLIFSLSHNNKFQYNQIAIIPPENSNKYVDKYTYSIHYKMYSNFKSTYSLVNNI